LRARVEAEQGCRVRVDAQREWPTHALKDRCFAHHASVVVKPVTHHEAQSVRVAGRYDDVWHGAVPGPELGGSILGLGDIGRDLTFDFDRIPRCSGPVVGKEGQRSCAQHHFVAVIPQRQDHAVSHATEQGRVDSRESRRDSCQLICDLVDGREIEIGAEPHCELAGNTPVVHRGAFRRDDSADVLHAAFKVGHAAGLFTPERAGQHDFGRLGTPGQERSDRDDLLRACDRASSEVDVGKIGDGIATEDHEDFDGAGRACFENFPCVEPLGPRNAAPPGGLNLSRPASSDTRPGKKPGTRPESIAPCTLPRRNAERNNTSGTSRNVSA